MHSYQSFLAKKTHSHPPVAANAGRAYSNPSQGLGVFTGNEADGFGFPWLPWLWMDTGNGGLAAGTPVPGNPPREW